MGARFVYRRVGRILESSANSVSNSVYKFCLEFSQPSSFLIRRGYVNTEKVLYCLILKPITIKVMVIGLSGLVDLNNIFISDWLIELSDNKLSNNKLFNNKLSDNNLASELVENRTFLNQSQARKL